MRVIVLGGTWFVAITEALTTLPSLVPADARDFDLVVAVTASWRGRSQAQWGRQA